MRPSPWKKKWGEGVTLTTKPKNTASMTISLRLTDLIAKKGWSIALLQKILGERGYAVMNIERPSHIINAIESGLDVVATFNEFRFLPIDKDFRYNDVKQWAFCSLFEISVAAFNALTHGISLPKL